MKKYARFLMLVFVPLLVVPSGCDDSAAVSATTESVNIALPEPQKDSDTSIEEALLGRRSVRSYGNEAVTLEQLGQLLWAAQGITSASGGRTAPSAGALYPLKVYAVIGDVQNIAPGLYVYEPASHALTKLKDGDLRQDLSRAALSQPSVTQAAVDIVITGNYEIITSKYGERGIRFTHLEAGHAAQNVCLQALGLKLGVVTIGAFDDAGVRKVLELPEKETPLYILASGNLPD